MKFFTKKSITQKIIIAIIISLLFGFVFPTYSQADVFGVLFDPIFEFVAGIGDSILSLLQNFLYNGRFEINGGLGSIFIGKAHFKIHQDKYPESAFSDPNGIAVKIDENDFDEISLTSILTTVISPIAGVIITGLDAVTGNNYMIPTLQYSVDKIFAGQIPAFDINFITPKDWGNDDKNDISIAKSLSTVISQWYNSLRNLAIIGLMSVLLYTGIRILISSTADDKAKYKQRLFDWIIAMCLLFFMHYIMAIILALIEIINDTISQSATSIPVIIDNSDGIQFNTHLMGLVRLQMQYKDIGAKTIYFILYVALLVYTCKYTWVYMKRTITMAFLTIIAPLVALTYPIDKMNDGKAQAFSAWIKEYIFTALLQPFHLILYTVLVGSAMQIAVKNPLYSILVIAFMGPAEKMLRKFFGFDKATSPGALSSAGAMFGGAAAFNMFKKGITAIGGKGGSGSGGGGNVRTVNNPVEDVNAPDGYTALANSSNRDLNNQQSQENQDNDIDEDAMMRNMYLGNDEVYAQDNANASNIQLSQNNDDIDEDEMMRNMYLGNDDQYINKDNNMNEESQDNSRQSIRLAEDSQKAQEEEYSEKLKEEQEKREKRKKDLSKALFISPIGRAGARQISESWQKNFGDKERAKDTGKRVLKSAIKTAGKAAVAGTVGAVGIGMGIAGDDLEDVLKYGAAGTVLGASAAPSIGKRISNSKLAQASKDEIGKTIYGSENTAAIRAQTAHLRETGELRNWAQETFLDDNGDKYSGKELNALEDRAIGHYNNGITEKGDIKRVMKLEDKLKKGIYSNLPEEERDQKSKEVSETIGKIAKDIEPGKLSDKKYVDGKLEEFKKGIKKANPELGKEDISENANQMMNMIMQYYKKP